MGKRWIRRLEKRAKQMLMARKRSPQMIKTMPHVINSALYCAIKVKQKANKKSKAIFAIKREPRKRPRMSKAVVTRMSVKLPIHPWPEAMSVVGSRKSKTSSERMIFRIKTRRGMKRMIAEIQCR